MRTRTREVVFALMLFAVAALAGILLIRGIVR
jgi:hypothetical protein